MKKEFTIWDGDCKVSIEVTQEKKDKVFESIIEWCKKHNHFSGEGICQNDDCIIDSPELISSIVDDIIKPEIEYID